jgi:hypothetical protein
MFLLNSSFNGHLGAISRNILRKFVNLQELLFRGDFEFGGSGRGIVALFHFSKFGHNSLRRD